MSHQFKCGDQGAEPAYPHHETHSDGSPYYDHLGFTKREDAAIKLRVPDSGTPWLDEMIRKANRLDIANHVIGRLYSSAPSGLSNAQLATECLSMADALLARIGGAK